MWLERCKNDDEAASVTLLLSNIATRIVEIQNDDTQARITPKPPKTSYPSPFFHACLPGASNPLDLREDCQVLRGAPRLAAIP